MMKHWATPYLAILVILAITQCGQAGNHKRFPGLAEDVAIVARHIEDCPTDDILCDNYFPFRTASGVCNNLNNPLFGSAGIPFDRYLPSVYEDGLGAPVGFGRSTPFPTPRQVSAGMSRTPTPPNRSPISLMVMQWGQFLDHDMVFTPEFEDEECCHDGREFHGSTPECLPLDVRGDSFFQSFDVDCLSFVRSTPTACATANGVREQTNLLTSFVDASNVYGSSDERQVALRTLSAGLLKVGEGQEILSGTCRAICPFRFLPNTAESETQFFAGDARAQEQPGLTSMHTLFVRAHNDIATQFSLKYPSANDEELFQNARRIVSALVQHITYNEWLPVVLGSASMNQHQLFPLPPNSNQYSTGYDPSVDASAANVFATAAFRFGHSLIADNFVLRNAIVPLSENFRNHDITLAQGTYPSDFLEGIAFARAEGMDHFMVDSITNKLFADGPQFSFGTDLMALNIMRARDHGLPGYNAWRQLCNLPTFSSFEELANVMPLQAAQEFSRLYNSVDDIDIFPAAIAEFAAVNGDGIAGPTLTCLIGKNFHDLKFGDRFFYESNAQPRPFSIDELYVIRRTTLASLICAYTDTPAIQRSAMLVQINGNPIEDCFSILQGTIPDLIGVVF